MAVVLYQPKAALHTMTWTQGRTVIGMRRMLFLIDEEGIIQQIWSTVKPADHAAEVLAAIQCR